ncbi:hypothetical protein PG994_009072 [Apiospora phragmitis]|uniref:Uncharacterized protein n=1 Tax=Apiospora phragmitis TaxID=2905665 RepID=A0ABR1UL82_9PEZI
MSQRGGTSGRLPVVTKLTGPQWCSSSSQAGSGQTQGGGDDEPATEDRRGQTVAGEGGAQAANNSTDGKACPEEEWDLVTNPGHEADNETDNSRVARGPGWSCGFNMEVGRGDWRLSLLSWEKRVGSQVQGKLPECSHAQK